MQRLNAGAVVLSILGLAWCEAAAQETAPSLEQVATGFRMAEGPVWDGESLYFTDVPASKILKLGSDGKVSTFRSDTRWGAGIAFDAKGHLIVCEVMGRRVTRVEKDGKETTLAETYGGKKLNGSNDLTVDTKGGIYFTDPLFLNKDKREQDKEAVYYINPEGKVLRVADDLEKPNGIELTKDGKTLFVADTAKSKLRAYPVKEDGTLGEGRDFGTVPGPDGVRGDPAGNPSRSARCTGTAPRPGRCCSRADWSSGASASCRHGSVTIGTTTRTWKKATAAWPESATRPSGRC